VAGKEVWKEKKKVAKKNKKTTTLFSQMDIISGN
jgi:hypothetical protein